MQCGYVAGTRRRIVTTIATGRSSPSSSIAERAVGKRFWAYDESARGGRLKACNERKRYSAHGENVVSPLLNDSIFATRKTVAFGPMLRIVSYADDSETILRFGGPG